jgi:hypothetical protein
LPSLLARARKEGRLPGRVPASASKTNHNTQRSTHQKQKRLAQAPHEFQIDINLKHNNDQRKPLPYQ